MRVDPPLQGTVKRGPVKMIWLPQLSWNKKAPCYLNPIVEGEGHSYWTLDESDSPEVVTSKESPVFILVLGHVHSQPKVYNWTTEKSWRKKAKLINVLIKHSKPKPPWGTHPTSCVDLSFVTYWSCVLPLTNSQELFQRVTWISESSFLGLLLGPALCCPAIPE